MDTIASPWRYDARTPERAPVAHSTTACDFAVSKIGDAAIVGRVRQAGAIVTSYRKSAQLEWCSAFCGRRAARTEPGAWCGLDARRVAGRSRSADRQLPHAVAGFA
jgi:hypothetical protein